MQPDTPSPESEPPIEAKLVEGDAPPPYPVKVGPTVYLAWVVILFLAIVCVSINQSSARRKVPETDARQSLPVDGLFELQAKFYVGFQFMSDMDVDLYAQAKTLDTGPVLQRLKFIALAGELAGPEAALEALATLRDEVDDDPEQATVTEQRTLAQLQRLYESYNEEEWSNVLSREEEAQLIAELGWFGKLALVPRVEIGQRNVSHVEELAAREAVVGSTLSTAIVFAIANMAVMMLGGLGLGFTIMFAFRFLTGRVQSNLVAGSRFSHIYIETFALWFFTYLVLQFAVSSLTERFHPVLLALCAFALSASTLLWPRIRGVPTRIFAEEVGLTRGRHPAVEFLVGCCAYCVMLPVVFVAVILTLQLVRAVEAARGIDTPDAFVPEQMPSHPIVNWIADGEASTILLVVLIAVVAAPLIEETMFRGLLYRHLRDLSAPLRIGLSVAFSSFASAFIFAVIHPQEWVQMVPLIVLASGCSIVREWRGSLIAAMTLHAINNLVTVSTVFLLL